MFVMGNICGDIEFELNCWNFGVTLGEVALCLIKFLDYLGSPEKD